MLFKLLKAIGRSGRDRVKCVLVGPTGAGKTTLIVSFFEKEFPKDHVPSVSSGYCVDRKVEPEGKTVLYSLWDTMAGEEMNRLRPLAYSMTDIFLLVFSVVKPEFLKLVEEMYLPEIRKQGSDIPIILVGTQSDLRTSTKMDDPEHREISLQECVLAAERMGAEKYMECSCLTQKGVEDIFDEALQLGYRRESTLAAKRSAEKSRNSGSKKAIQRSSYVEA